MEFPKNEGTGKVSTTSVNKQIWKSFLSPLARLNEEKDYVKEAKKLLQEIEEIPSKDWRHGYIPIVNRAVELQAQASPEECLQMCDSALKELHKTMLFKSQPINAVMENMQEDEGEKISSRIVNGTKEASDPVIQMPVSDGKGSVTSISGENLEHQLKSWVEYGCMESSAAINATKMAATLSRGDEPKSALEDYAFVLLGATSELGPALPLADWGATIVAISRPGHKLNSLTEYVKNQTPQTTMVLPVLEHDGKSADECEAGLDVLEHVPQVSQWIANLYPQKRLVLIPLIYLDGEANVRVVTAMDAIIQYVMEKRPNNAALAYWISPGTPHAISKEAALDAERRFERANTPFWHKPFRLLPSFGFQRNPISHQANHDLYIYNGLADLQGPNYALSKCIQQWRAMLSSPKFVHDLKAPKAWAVSANVSPPARTQSMVSHSTVAAWLNGIEAFPPMTVFEPATARVLMTLLLLNDLFTPQSPGQDQHPVELFIENSVHGGCWRMPYDLNSVGTISYVLGKVKG